MRAPGKDLCMSLTATAVAVMISSVAPKAVDPATTAPTSQPAVEAGAAPQIPVSPDVAASEVPAAPAAEAPAAGAQDAAPAAGAGSEIVVMPRKAPPPEDPLERINEKSFETVQAVDKAVLEPVAKVYNKGLPKPVRQGLRNFFSNLGEPVVFVAYLLELKPGKAFETAGRFAINSTIGAAGFVDMAKRKPFNLPYRPNGLANVLGYYGVKPGPYFYLPIVGPTTLRDIIGDSVDRLLLPAAVGSPFNKPEVVIPSTILSQLGERAAFDEQIRDIRQQDNPYAYYRELYLKQREAEIEALHGRVVPDAPAVYGPGMKTAGKPKPAEEAAPAVTPEAPTDATPPPAEVPVTAPEPAPATMH